MRLLRDVLAALAVALLVIAAADFSPRAFAAALLMFAAAYGIHRRSVIFWWLVCLFLSLSFAISVQDAVSGPRTIPAMAGAALGMLFVTFLSSVWWRHRSHFRKRVSES